MDNKNPKNNDTSSQSEAGSQKKRKMIDLSNNLQTNKASVLSSKFADFKCQGDWQILVKQVNVEQGDASLIIIRDSQNIQKFCMLIDGGTRYTHISKNLLDSIKEENLHSIDYIVISHYDADHFQGIIELLSMTNPQHEGRKRWHSQEQVDLMTKLLSDTIFVDPGDEIGTKTSQSSSEKTEINSEAGASKQNKGLSYFQQYKDLLQKLNKVRLSAGMSAQSSDLVGANILECYPGHYPLCKNPLESVSSQLIVRCIAQNGFYLAQDNSVKQADSLKGSKSHSKNAQSLGFLISIKSFKIYTAGDLTSSVELALSNSFKSSKINVNVMKLSHHGSNTSTPEQLLEALQPQVILCSHGSNNCFGHPHLEVVDRAFQKMDKQKLTHFIFTNPLNSGHIQGNMIQWNENMKLTLIEPSNDGKETRLRKDQQLVKIKREVRNLEWFEAMKGEFINIQIDVAEQKLYENIQNRKGILKSFADKAVARADIKIFYQVQSERYFVSFKQNPIHKTIFKPINYDKFELNIDKTLQHSNQFKICYLIGLDQEKYSALKGILNLTSKDCEYSSENQIYLKIHKQCKLGNSNLTIGKMNLTFSQDQNSVEQGEFKLQVEGSENQEYSFSLDGLQDVTTNKKLRFINAFPLKQALSLMKINSTILTLNKTEEKKELTLGNDDIFLKYGFKLLENLLKSQQGMIPKGQISISFQPFHSQIAQSINILIPIIENPIQIPIIDAQIGKLYLSQTSKYKCFYRNKENEKFLNEKFTRSEYIMLTGELRIQNVIANFQIQYDSLSEYLTLDIEPNNLTLEDLQIGFGISNALDQIYNLFKFKSIRLVYIGLEGQKQSNNTIMSPKFLTVWVKINLENTSSIFNGYELDGRIIGAEFILKITVNIQNKSLQNWELILSEGSLLINKLLESCIPNIKQLELPNLELNSLKIGSLSDPAKTFSLYFSIAKEFTIKFGEKKIKCENLSIQIQKIQDEYSCCMDLMALFENHRGLLTLEYTDSWQFRIQIQDIDYKSLSKSLPQKESTDNLNGFQDNLDYLGKDSYFNLHQLMMEITWKESLQSFILQGLFSYQFQLPILELQISGISDINILHEQDNQTSFTLTSKDFKIDDFQCNFVVNYNSADKHLEFNMSDLSIKKPNFLSSFSNCGDKTIVNILKADKKDLQINQVQIQKLNGDWSILLNITISDINVKLYGSKISDGASPKKWFFDLRLNNNKSFSNEDTSFVLKNESELVEKVQNFEGELTIQYLQQNYFMLKAQVKFKDQICFQIANLEIKLTSAEMAFYKLDQRAASRKNDGESENIFQLMKRKLKDALPKFLGFSNYDKILQVKAIILLGKIKFTIVLPNILQKNFEFIGEVGQQKNLKVQKWLEDVSDEKQDPECQRFIPDLFIDSLQIYGNPKENIIEVQIGTQIGKIKVIIFKGDDKKRGFFINVLLDAQDEQSNSQKSEIVEFFKNLNIDLNSIVVAYATKSNRELNIQKGLNAEAKIDMRKNDILNIIFQMFKIIDPTFDGFLSFRYDRITKRLQAGFSGQLILSLFGLIQINFRKIYTTQGSFEIDCMLKLPFIDIIFEEIKIQYIMGKLMVKYGFEFEKPQLILPGLRLKKLSLNGTIHPLVSSTDLGFTVEGEIQTKEQEKGDKDFQISIFTPDPKLPYIPQFMIQFPTNFELKLSTLAAIFFGINSFPTILDIAILSPFPGKSKIEMTFLGLTNISISCQLKLLHIFTTNLLLEVGMENGIHAIVESKPVKLLNNIIELISFDDSSKGPKTEIILNPFNNDEKFKLLIDGKAKIFGLLAGIKVVVSSVSGVEIKFFLDLNSLNRITFKSAFSLVLQPEKSLELKNQLQFKFDLRIPSFNIGPIHIPQINLFFIEVQINLKITEKYFYLAGKLEFNILNVPISLDFTGDDAFVIEYCSLEQLPIQLSLKLIKIIPKLFTKLAQNILQLLEGAFKKLLDLFHHAINAVCVFFENLFMSAEEKERRQIAEENRKYKETYLLANEKAKQKKYDEAFQLYKSIDGDMQKYTHEGFTTVPVELCIQIVMENIAHNSLKAITILNVLHTIILIDKNINQVEYNNLSLDEQSDNDYFMGITLCLLGHLNINNSEAYELDKQNLIRDGYSKIEKASKLQPYLLEPLYLLLLHHNNVFLKTQQNINKKNPKEEAQEKELNLSLKIWKILKIMNGQHNLNKRLNLEQEIALLNEITNNKLALEEEIDLLNEITNNKCEKINHYQMHKQKCAIFHQCFFPLIIRYLGTFYKQRDKCISKQAHRNLLQYSVFQQKNYDQYFQYQKSELSLTKEEQLKQIGNKKINDLGLTKEKEKSQQEILDATPSDQSIIESQNDFNKFVQKVSDCSFSLEDLGSFCKKSSLILKGVRYFYSINQFKIAYEICEKLFKQKDRQVFTKIILNGKRGQTLLVTKYYNNIIGYKANCHYYCASIKIKQCPVPNHKTIKGNSNINMTTQYCKECYKEIINHLDYFLLENKQKITYIEFLANNNTIQTIENDGNVIHEQRFEIDPPSLEWKYTEVLEQQRKINELYENFKGNQNILGSYQGLVKGLNDCKRILYQTEKIILFVDQYYRHNINYQQVIDCINTEINIRTLILASFNLQLQLRSLYDKTGNGVFLENSLKHLDSLIAISKIKLGQIDSSVQCEAFRLAVQNYYKAVQNLVSSNNFVIFATKPIKFSDKSSVFKVIESLKEAYFIQYQQINNILRIKKDEVQYSVNRIGDKKLNEIDYQKLKFLSMLLKVELTVKFKSNSEQKPEIIQKLIEQERNNKQDKNKGFAMQSDTNQNSLESLFNRNSMNLFDQDIDDSQDQANQLKPKKQNQCNTSGEYLDTVEESKDNTQEIVSQEQINDQNENN